MIQAAKIIGTILATMGLIGAGVCIGVVFGALILSVSTNPSLRGELFSYTFLGFASAKIIGLFALVIAYILLCVVHLEALETTESDISYLILCYIDLVFSHMHLVYSYKAITVISLPLLIKLTLTITIILLTLIIIVLYQIIGLGIPFLFLLSFFAGLRLSTFFFFLYINSSSMFLNSWPI